MELALTMSSLHGTFPVGAIVKALPVIPSQAGFSGEVITNDGVDFEVKWDFTGVITKHNIAAEAKRAADDLEKTRRWFSELTKEAHGTPMDGLDAGAYARGTVRGVLERVAPPTGVA